MSSARLVICALVCLAGLSPSRAWADTPGSGTRHLVVPFDSTSGEPRVYWLTEASAVLLADELTALGVPAVSRDDRLLAFERLRVPAAVTLSHATVIRLAQVLGAPRVVVGTYDLRGETLTVRARTIRLDDGQISAEVVEQGPLLGLFDIYARLAHRLVPGASGGGVRPEPNYTPAAFEQYIKGLLADTATSKIAFLNDAIRLAPAFQRPRLALWAVHHDQDDERKALAVVQAVPADHSLSRRARFLAAISLLGLGRLDEAFERLSELNRASPDPALLNNLGIVQLRRGAGAAGGRAATFFSDAAKLDRADTDVLFNLGYASWLERDIASAIPWLREAVRRNPTDAEAHFVLGAALLAAGNGGEGARERELARRLSSELADLDKQNAAVPRGLERVKLDVDVPSSLRVDTAIASAGQREQRELAAFHLDAGRRFFASGRDTDAVTELRRAVYLDPYQGEAHLLLGRLFLRGGRALDAVDELKISLWSTESVTTRLALAEAYVAARDEMAARAELQTVLSRDPQNEDASRLLDSLTQ
ncbi:MAG TPA: tetratricopeptide repeat protein [Vicinamibacterales bacterium]|nr:tetratricopeptide repeat protein [Vicinamibacterales bacterium]